MTTLDAFELVELAGRDHAEPLDVAVLVHEGDSEPREELAQLREHTGAPVVLATTAPSSGLVRWALDAGIADVLPLPAGRESVLFVIEKAAQTAADEEDLFLSRGGDDLSASDDDDGDVYSDDYPAEDFGGKPKPKAAAAEAVEPEAAAEEPTKDKE